MKEFAWRLLSPLLDWRRTWAAIAEYPAFVGDLRRYRALGGEALTLDLFPQLHDHMASSPFDPHYFFQDSWAAQRIAESAPAQHVDVGSRVDLVAFLTAITSVTFVDIRPLEVEMEGLTSVEGSVLDLPFADRSQESISCLHVAEHIGLGRYGDPLDPMGTVNAAKELARVLAPGGKLLFSGPVGRPRTMFNAHRVHAPEQVRAMFGELELIEFAGVDDGGEFARHRELSELADCEYGCGMFLFGRIAV
ncbi:MAG: DUF268 domain-containing protein [Actinomycetota bacterium]